jgi:hypothetical protein
MSDYSRGTNVFALLVSGLALVVGLGMAWLRVDAGDPAWLFAVPVVLAPIAYLFLVRRKEERLLPTTTRGYTMHTAQFADAPLSDLIARVEKYGYHIDALDLKANAAPKADAKLGNGEYRLRERSAPVSFGEISLRITVQPNGNVLGYLEATDSQPGFYDELAQYVIAEIAEMQKDLEFTHSATGVRRPASELRAELPESPYGLSLLA